MPLPPAIRVSGWGALQYDGSMKDRVKTRLQQYEHPSLATAWAVGAGWTGSCSTMFCVLTRTPMCASQALRPLPLGGALVGQWQDDDGVDS